MPAEQFTYVSSRLVKEIAALGGSLEGLVPASVETRLARRRAAAMSRSV
jgi:phosphopantetheine adenylyltransferase